MNQPHPDHSSSPDGSAGWDALPPDGESPAGDAADDDPQDTEASSGDEPGRPSSIRS